MESTKAKKRDIKFKDKNGITLIALVITIIVLLILAGVSIAMLTGENGILTQANTAKTRTKEAQIEEEIKLAYNSIQPDSYINGWDINKKAEVLQSELRKKDTASTVIVNGTELEIMYKDYNTTISEKGMMGEMIKSTIEINEFYISGTPVVTVPVPEGFYHVGGTVDEGYVISDNIADEGKGVDANLVGNQFVWVPVDKDQKITINVTSEEEITDIILTDPYGEDLEIPDYSGKKYNAEITPTINGRYKLVVKNAKETKEEKIDVYSLYAIRMWDVDTWLSEEFLELSETSLEEYINSMGYNSVEELEQYHISQFMDNGFEETEVIDHISKVNKNGGFYIGRYESTYEKIDEIEKVAVKKATSTRTIDTVTLTNGMLWNYINQENALIKAKAYNENVGSTLLTGAAWDRTLGWLYETGEVSLSDIIVESSKWGNYVNDIFSNTTSVIKTGEFEETSVNNIYDFAGNLSEFTTESSGSSVIDRGGRFDGRYYFMKLAYDRGFSQSTLANSITGFRVALFM